MNETHPPEKRGALSGLSDEQMSNFMNCIFKCVLTGFLAKLLNHCY